MSSIEQDLKRLSRSAVQDAHHQIGGYVHVTPVLTSTSINQIVSRASCLNHAHRGNDKATDSQGQTNANVTYVKNSGGECTTHDHDDDDTGDNESRAQHYRSIRSHTGSGNDSESNTKKDNINNNQIQNDIRLELFFKCENFQKIGAFKARGAFYNVLSLPDEAAAKGVCTHSSGNHAQALALAARTRGIPAHIVMPGISTPSKIAATRGYGANVHFSGSTAAEREAVLEEIQAKTGATFIPPYDYAGTILGQGTVGLELEQQAHELIVGDKGGSYNKRNTGAGSDGSNDSGDLDAVIAPLGGGGLLGGIATALAGQTWNGHPALIYGAEPSHEGADDAVRGLAADPPTRIEQVKSLTIADGLRTPVGVLNWRVISDKTQVRGVFAVSDEQIKEALVLLLERLKVWVEPSAAVGLAVLLFDEAFRHECRVNMARYRRDSWRVGIVLSGGNTTVQAIAGFFGGQSSSSSSMATTSHDETVIKRAEAKQGLHGEGATENVAG